MARGRRLGTISANRAARQSLWPRPAGGHSSGGQAEQPSKGCSAIFRPREACLTEIDVSRPASLEAPMVALRGGKQRATGSQRAAAHDLAPAELRQSNLWPRHPNCHRCLSGGPPRGSALLSSALCGRCLTPRPIIVRAPVPSHSARARPWPLGQQAMSCDTSLPEFRLQGSSDRASPRRGRSIDSDPSARQAAWARGACLGVLELRELCCDIKVKLIVVWLEASNLGQLELRAT